MAFDENLEQIRKRGMHYLVAGLQAERNQWLDELENDDGWEEVHRALSPRNPFQKDTRGKSAREERLKSRFTTRLAHYWNRKRPTDFAEEAKFLRFWEITIQQDRFA